MTAESRERRTAGSCQTNSHHKQLKGSFAGHQWQPQRASWRNILAENVTVVLRGGWERGNLFKVIESDRAGRKDSVGEQRLKKNYRQILIFSLSLCWLLFQMCRGDNSTWLQRLVGLCIYTSHRTRFDFQFCSNKNRDAITPSGSAGLVTPCHWLVSPRTWAAQGPLSFVFKTGIIQNVKDGLLQQCACTEITCVSLTKFSFNEAEVVAIIRPATSLETAHTPHDKVGVMLLYFPRPQQHIQGKSIVTPSVPTTATFSCFPGRKRKPEQAKFSPQICMNKTPQQHTLWLYVPPHLRLKRGFQVSCCRQSRAIIDQSDDSTQYVALILCG